MQHITLAYWDHLLVVKKSSRGRIHNTVVSLAKHEATNKAGEGGQIGSRVQGDLLKGEKKKDIIFYNI